MEPFSLKEENELLQVVVEDCRKRIRDLEAELGSALKGPSGFEVPPIAIILEEQLAALRDRLAKCEKVVDFLLDDAQWPLWEAKETARAYRKEFPKEGAL